MVLEFLLILLGVCDCCLGDLPEEALDEALDEMFGVVALMTKSWLIKWLDQMKSAVP